MGREKPKILFLSAHVQPFLLSGIHKLVTCFDAEVMVVSWPQPSNYPLVLRSTENVRFLVKEESDFSTIQAAVLAFDPNIIYSAGWMDSDYLQLAQRLKNSGKKTVMGMDTQWTGAIKQRIHCMLAPWKLHNKFTHAWVPGHSQYEYARRLGFRQENILLRLLVPDTEVFEKAYAEYKEAKAKDYPRTFVYAGRLVDSKFGKLLQAFNQLNETERNGWKLIVAGDGPLKEHPSFSSNGIDYRGFLQPEQLKELVKEAGVFCLLSDEEPWGTVIEEFAHAGLPLLLSVNCGAAYSFLIDQYNGWLVKDNTADDIGEHMRHITKLPGELLTTMGDRSHQLAQSGTSEAWAATLMSVL